jgi:hypothetical protein
MCFRAIHTIVTSMKPVQIAAHSGRSGDWTAAPGGSGNVRKASIPGMALRGPWPASTGLAVPGADTIVVVTRVAVSLGKFAPPRESSHYCVQT